MVLFEPQSDWKPHAFPRLDSEKIVAIDIESRDPGLLSHGPGFIRGDASVVGISVATAERGWYFPIGHLGGGNLDRDKVTGYFNALLANPELTVVGANLMYDIEGLDSLGIRIAGRCLDIQIAEALIDEEQESYALDTLSHKYLGRGKDERLLRESAATYGVDPKSGLWKMPARFVGPYAEADAHNTLCVLQKQLKILESDALLDIFQMESELLPILWKMRKQGIPVNLPGATKLSEALFDKEDQLRTQVEKQVGFKINEWSQEHIASICRKLGIPIPRTARGNPSFTGDWLEQQTEATLRLVSEIRVFNRLRTTFVEEWFFRNQVNERVHPQWHQLRSNEGGTRTGRLAASHPNPQQIPGRSESAALVRALFCAPPGLSWAKFDYSQQEPRILVHYSSLCKFTGASLVAQAYHNNAAMDIYQFLAESCNMSRRDAKDATLGRCYGMGVAKFSQKQGISHDVAKQKLDEFDRSVPFIREMADYCMNLAQQRGWIKTICGRKRHFNFYEPINAFDLRDRGTDITPVRLRLAEAKWPGERLRRAHTHKALNALIQGSAADMTKAAMIQVHEKLGLVPYIQVHDELNYGVTGMEQAEEIKQILESCVEMTVPIKADLSIGEHWK